MPSYQIIGSDAQAVVCDLSAGERVIAEAGHLLAMTDGLALQTTTGGGFLSGLKRSFGGSSFFVNEVVAASPGRALFASPTIGKIHTLEVTPAKHWFCQPHVFLCSDTGVSQKAAFTKRFGAGLFGGTGFVLQSLEGEGQAFVHVGGMNVSFALKPGESLRVETGSLAAFESTVTYDIEMVRGVKSILFSGEGLWFAHLSGPGTVILQSLATPRLAHSLAPYLQTQMAKEDAVQAGGAAAVVSILQGLFGGSDS